MLRNSPAVYLLAILCAMIVTPAQAGVQRAFVASYGSNSNTTFNCDATHPCRGFASAATVVNPDGEVVALDSGAYGPAILTQSISLTAAPGIYAGMSVFSVSAAGVSIPTSNINVVLRGLTINGQGGNNGILLTGNSNLSIENCIISNFSGSGQRGIFVNAAATVRMVDSLVRDNDTGVELQGGATADISGSKFLGNGSGILATSTASTITAVTISDTIVTGGINGVVASSGTSGTSRIDVIRATVTDNTTVGVKSSASAGSAKVTLSDSLVSGNGTGLFQSGTGILDSLGNNTVTNNTPDLVGSKTAIPLM